MADRYYSEEQAQEILRLAARRSGEVGGMSRERLVQAASEMGIDPTEILAAEREVMERENKKDLRRQFNEASRKSFYNSLSSFVGTSITLFGINYLTGGFHSIWSTWAIWPCGFMLIGTAKEAWEYLTIHTPIGDEEFERWLEKQDKKQRVSQWIEQHSESMPALQVAKLACAEFGPDKKSHAIKAVRRKTGLSYSESQALVEAVYREQVWGTLRQATTPVSPYQAAQQAVIEVGPDRKTDAVRLVRERTGVGTEEAYEAVQAVVELSH